MLAKRCLVTGLLLVFLAMAAAACVPVQAPVQAAIPAVAPSAATPKVAGADPTTLTVYDRLTDLQSSVEAELIVAFESKHNVKVNLVSADDPVLFARFVSEEKNGLPTAEVFAGWNPVGVLQLQQQGYLQAYVPPSLVDRIPERFRSPVVIQHTGLSALAYNPNKLGNLPPPASYADLAKPIYKDKIEMPDPIASTTVLKLVGHLALSTPLGWSFWSQLHANGVRLVGQVSQVQADVANPDSPAAIGIVGYGTAYPAEKAGKPIKVVIPAEGLVGSEYVVAIATKAPHPDLARAFVDEVTFNPKLLDEWANRHLPVTVEGFAAPAGTPPLDQVVISNWQLLRDKELEIRTQWQAIVSQ
jgi:iron(III) transport system substrate-binding protein